MPIDGVLYEGQVFRAPGYWISTDGLAIYREALEGCGEKNAVLRKVEVRQGVRPIDVILVGAGALVVGVGGGVVWGVAMD